MLNQFNKIDHNWQLASELSRVNYIVSIIILEEIYYLLTAAALQISVDSLPCVPASSNPLDPWPC